MNEEFFLFFFFFITRCRKLDEWQVVMITGWTAVGREVVKRHEEASPLSLQRLREPGADRVYTRVRNKGYNKNTNDGSIFPDDLRTFSQLVVQSLKTMFHHSHIYIYICENNNVYTDKKKKKRIKIRFIIVSLIKKKIIINCLD